MGGWESREEEEGKKEIERKMEENLEWERRRGGGEGGDGGGDSGDGLAVRAMVVKDFQCSGQGVRFG